MGTQGKLNKQASFGRIIAVVVIVMIVVIIDIYWANVPGAMAEYLTNVSFNYYSNYLIWVLLLPPFIG